MRSLRHLIAELKGAYAPMTLSPGAVVRIEMHGQTVQGKVASSQMGKIVINTPGGDVEIFVGGDQYVAGGSSNARAKRPHSGTTGGNEAQ